MHYMGAALHCYGMETAYDACNQKWINTIDCVPFKWLSHRMMTVADNGELL